MNPFWHALDALFWTIDGLGAWLVGAFTIPPAPPIRGDDPDPLDIDEPPY